MWSESGTVTFSTAEPLADTLPALRAAFSGQGFRIVTEFDVSHRVKETLGITLPPCKILYLWPGTAIGEAVSPATAVFLPLHIVVADHGHRSDISLVRDIEDEPQCADDSIKRVIERTRIGTVRCLESICVRGDLA